MPRFSQLEITPEWAAEQILSLSSDGYAPTKTQYDADREKFSPKAETILLRLGYVVDGNGWRKLVTDLTGLTTARAYTLPTGKRRFADGLNDEDTPEMIRKTELEELNRGFPVCRTATQRQGTQRDSRQWLMLR